MSFSESSSLSPTNGTTSCDTISSLTEHGSNHGIITKQTGSIETSKLRIKISTDTSSKMSNESSTYPQITPTPKTPLNNISLSTNGALPEDILLIHGYKKQKQITRTLQGEVFIANKFKSLLVSGYVREITPHWMDTTGIIDICFKYFQRNTKVAIKRTNKLLHCQGITITKTGKKFRVKENIVKEAEMMRKFMKNEPPSSLVEFCDFLEDDENYYLVMEYGGKDYFDFIVKCHEMIKNGELSIKEWRKHCKYMFSQMVQFIRWMHEKMHCCNLDISLENMVITDSVYLDKSTGKLKNCNIKYIDFGLSECFDLNKNPSFLCRKYVGKTHYKAPKVYAKKEQFMANKADIWSLGACLFMMSIGAPPYKKPAESDPCFRYILNGQIRDLVHSWGRIQYLTTNSLDLLEKMLCVDESKRITMDEIVKHPWISMYFAEDSK